MDQNETTYYYTDSSYSRRIKTRYMFCSEIESWYYRQYKIFFAEKKFLWPSRQGRARSVWFDQRKENSKAENIRAARIFFSKVESVTGTLGSHSFSTCQEFVSPAQLLLVRPRRERRSRQQLASDLCEVDWTTATYMDHANFHCIFLTAYIASVNN